MNRSIYAGLVALLLAAPQVRAEHVARVKDINTAAPSGSAFPKRLFPLGDLVIFQADDGINGVELWRTDGTDAGTTLVKDVEPGPGSSFASPVATMNDSVFFLAFDSAHGGELWKTDGTEAGTVVVKDIAPGAASGFQGSPFSFRVVDDALFFVANDGPSGLELWKTDGTDTGTVLVKDVHPGPADGLVSTYVMTSLDDILYFFANDGITGVELWRSDGTDSGTVLVKDTQPGFSIFARNGPTAANGLVFFTADDGVHGEEPWKSDGTAAGTSMLKDIAPSGGSYPGIGIAVAGHLYLVADDGTSGFELWSSDGTEVGTHLVKDINPGPASSYAGVNINLNGALIFEADDSAHGPELWRSDGTEAGTQLVRDIFPGPDTSLIQGLTPAGPVAYFGADNGETGVELWKTDGTTDGTVLLSEIRPGPEPSGLEPFGTVGTRFYFAADDGVSGQELWSADQIATSKLWLGLKNSDDQGTRFDVRAALYINAALVAEGQALCVEGVTRNASQAKEVSVPFGPLTDTPINTGDAISLKASSRIGTNSDGTKCQGHNNAAGLRLYYDGASRPSALDAQITQGPLDDYFLHLTGGSFTLDTVSPAATNAKQKDSGPVHYSGGNPWVTIGTWQGQVAPQP